MFGTADQLYHAVGVAKWRKAGPFIAFVNNKRDEYTPKNVPSLLPTPPSPSPPPKKKNGGIMLLEMHCTTNFTETRVKQFGRRGGGGDA